MKKSLLTSLLLTVLLPMAVWGNIYTDIATGIVYEYEAYEDSAQVAAGLKFESDMFSQMTRFGTEIAENAVIAESFEVDGKTYEVTSIGVCAFAESTGIRTITIPKSVFYIGGYAFSGCSSVTDVYCYANPNWLNWFPSYNDFKSGRATVCHVPAAWLNTFQSKFSRINVTFVGDLEGDTGGVSIVSTFNDGWAEIGGTDAPKAVMLNSDEGNSWVTLISDASAPVRFMRLGSSSTGDQPETCVCIGENGGGSMEVNMMNNFAVSGHVKKVIVRSAPNIQIINAELKERSGSGSDVQHAFVSCESSHLFNDNVLAFDGTKEYANAVIRLTLSGVSPFFLHSITIVQEDGGVGPAMSGTTGSLKWQVEESGTIEMWSDGIGTFTRPAYRLTISGTGYMPDYNITGWDNEAHRTLLDTPWNPFETITEVVVEEGVKSIGRWAFSLTNFLNRVSLPSSLERIEPFAFDHSGVAFINFPEGLRYIGSNAFHGCYYMRTIALPSTLTEVSPASFLDNMIKTLTIADGNPKFDSRDGSNSIILSATNELFMGTLGTVIPESVTSIGRDAFRGNSNLESFEIPDCVTNIDEAAFDSCYSMKKLTIGSGVKNIADKAFLFCVQMEDVICYANPATLTWAGNDHMWNFTRDKAARFHVRAADLPLWESRFPDLNATYVADLVGASEPITSETSVSVGEVAESGTATTTPSGVTISLGAGDSTSPEEGSVTMTTTMTSTELTTLLESVMPGTSAFTETFKGFYFLLAAGKGYVEIDVATMGSYVMSVMKGVIPVGDYVMADKGTIRIEYDVTEDTWFFIYPSVTAPSSVRAYRAPAETDGALKVYNIRIVPTEVIDEISAPSVETEGGTIYDLSGRQIVNGKLHRGIYIINGRKVMR